MPNTVTRFQCPICKNEYRSFDQALSCEMLPTPVDEFNVGDILTYEDESSMFGSRYSYCTVSGKILYKHYCRRNEINGLPAAHAVVYIVESRYGEAEVSLLPNEFGTMQLISLANMKYQHGYADSVIQAENSW